MKSENRLRKNKQFEYVYKKGERFYSKNISLFFTKSKFQTVKVGFSVSKKIGKSVVRSRVKRVMTEAFNVLLPRVNQTYNYIFSAKPEIVSLSFLEVLKEMETCLKKANLLND